MNKKVKKYLKVGARATGILFLLLSINEPAIALTADASKTIAVSPTIIETTGPEIAATPIPNNSPVKLHGFVLSLPGQFGSQYFYLYNNQEVVQIYNYWKKFPDFKINDYLEVAATFSAQTKIKRFKTKETTDIRSLKNISSDPRAKPLSAAELNSLTPNFVSLSGKIGALKKSSFYLRYQDKETLVDLKNLINFDLSELKIDDELKVNGLLFNDAGTSRLYPRLSSDIVKIAGALKITATPTPNNKNLSNKSVLIPATGRANSPWLKYLGLFLTCFLIFIIIRKR